MYIMVSGKLGLQNDILQQSLPPQAGFLNIFQL